LISISCRASTTGEIIETSTPAGHQSSGTFGGRAAPLLRHAVRVVAGGPHERRDLLDPRRLGGYRALFLRGGRAQRDDGGPAGSP
jgi:hypothetical protein